MHRSRSYDEVVQEGCTDWDVAGWEEHGEEFKLYVCSLCGLIASETIDHEDCTLQDWWHLDVKAFQKEPQD